MEKMDTKMVCPKCEFKPTYSETWKLEYKDQCYQNSTCGWKDNVIKEHMHMKCPECGYVEAAPTADYDVLSGNVWTSAASTTEVITKAPAPVGKNPVRADVLPLITACTANRGTTGGVAQPNATPEAPVTVLKPNTFVQKPLTPAKCRQCPVEADGTPKATPTV